MPEPPQMTPLAEALLWAPLNCLCSSPYVRVRNTDRVISRTYMWLIPSTLGRKLISDAQISHEAKLMGIGEGWTANSLFTTTDRLSCTADTAMIHPSISCSILRYLKSSIWGSNSSPSWSGSEWAILPFEDHGLRFTGAESQLLLFAIHCAFSTIYYLHYFSV